MAASFIAGEGLAGYVLILMPLHRSSHSCFDHDIALKRLKSIDFASWSSR